MCRGETGLGFLNFFKSIQICNNKGVIGRTGVDRIQKFKILDTFAGQGSNKTRVCTPKLKAYQKGTKGTKKYKIINGFGFTNSPTYEC